MEPVPPGVVDLADTSGALQVENLDLPNGAALLSKETNEPGRRTTAVEPLRGSVVLRAAMPTSTSPPMETPDRSRNIHGNLAIEDTDFTDEA